VDLWIRIDKVNVLYLVIRLDLKVSAMYIFSIPRTIDYDDQRHNELYSGTQYFRF